MNLIKTEMLLGSDSVQISIDIELRVRQPPSADGKKQLLGQGQWLQFGADEMTHLLLRHKICISWTTHQKEVLDYKKVLHQN